MIRKDIVIERPEGTKIYRQRGYALGKGLMMKI